MQYQLSSYKYATMVFILSILLASHSPAKKLVYIYLIPTQTINPYNLIADNSDSTILTIKEFQISKQVTFIEYKEYLASVKRDSTYEFYLTQLPDSSIGSEEVYKKYLCKNDYNNFPVLGISWDNAMNFCKWKTIKNNDDNIQFVYRLPSCSEWLAAYNYLKTNKINHEFNQNYSDWLINSKDESTNLFRSNIPQKEFIYDWIYFHKNNDPLVLKRKQVIGNSFLYQQENIMRYSFSFYANEGYKQIGFRYIIEPLSKLNDTNKKNKGIAKSLLNYWGLKN